MANLPPLKNQLASSLPGAAPAMPNLSGGKTYMYPGMAPQKRMPSAGAAMNVMPARKQYLSDGLLGAMFDQLHPKAAAASVQQQATPPASSQSAAGTEAHAGQQGMEVSQVDTARMAEAEAIRQSIRAELMRLLDSSGRFLA